MTSVAPPLRCKMGLVKKHPSDTGKYRLLCSRDADHSPIVCFTKAVTLKKGEEVGGMTIKLLFKKKKVISCSSTWEGAL